MSFIYCISPNLRESLKTNTVEGKLTNNRIAWYGHVLKLNEERTPKKVLNMKVKGKHPR
jgi:hypothetical protein